MKRLWLILFFIVPLIGQKVCQYDDGNKQAVLAFYTYKDEKIYTVETGASNLPK